MDGFDADRVSDARHAPVGCCRSGDLDDNTNVLTMLYLRGACFGQVEKGIKLEEGAQVRATSRHVPLSSPMRDHNPLDGSGHNQNNGF